VETGTGGGIGAAPAHARIVPALRHRLLLMHRSGTRAVGVAGADARDSVALEGVRLRMGECDWDRHGRIKDPARNDAISFRGNELIANEGGPLRKGQRLPLMNSGLVVLRRKRRLD
jgi:hypothetical protein